MIKVRINHKTRQVLFENKGLKLINNAMRESLNEIGQLISKETAQGILRPPKTGRRYGSHRASKPGEYPANKTGKLRKSINYKTNSYRKMTVGIKAEYAKYLEEGTRDMGARKLLGYTIDNNRNKIKNIIRANANGELK